MNEEEKKAIEELEEFIKGPCETCKYCEAAYKLNRKNIIQLLNLTKKIQKENEELKRDRNNNYQMIALAQNEALGYIQGYEDGKKLKRSAVANIVENQQYYILNEQIEYYKEYIKELRKKNEELKNDYENLSNSVVVKNYYIENSIPVQKVKDKIEELENYIQENSDEQGYWGNINSDIIYGKIEILEESLEESED